MNPQKHLAFPELKIVSGGQTGADRAGLDFAIANGIPHGGWCPKGRKSLDGPIDAKYLLKDTPTGNYLQRTEWNARDADATVIFTVTSELGGGSKKTADFARKHGRPFLHLSKSIQGDHAKVLKSFLLSRQVKTLNVAGSRESKEPAVAAFVTEVLSGALLEVATSSSDKS